MKQCPTCQSQYTDDTLQFCLQDGTPLKFVAGSPSAAYGEQETVVSNRQSSQTRAPQPTNPTGWNPGQYQSNAGFETAEKKSSATAVFLTAFVMLLLFGLVGMGVWLYYRGVNPDENTNILLAKKTPNPEIAANTSSTAPAKPTPAATVSSSNTAANTNSAPVDKEKIKQDAAQRINSWASAAESLDLDKYMSHYAATVDYYNKKGASQGFVRADKQKAFSTYDSIRITLSNLTVTPDASGERATAVVDKEWNFSNAEKTNAGKVKQQLELRKINGQWLIAAERDLKVYYTQN